MLASWLSNFQPGLLVVSPGRSERRCFLRTHVKSTSFREHQRLLPSMAEAIAVGASVIAIIQAADRVIGLCKYYLEIARDAPSDLRSILVETSTLKTVLENLTFLMSCDDPTSTSYTMLLRDDGPIQGCQKTIGQLEGLLPTRPSQSAKPKSSKRRRVESVLTALAWPLKEEKARKLLHEISRYKSTLDLALTATTAYLLHFSVLAIR